MPGKATTAAASSAADKLRLFILLFLRECGSEITSRIAIRRNENNGCATERDDRGVGAIDYVCSNTPVNNTGPVGNPVGEPPFGSTLTASTLPAAIAVRTSAGTSPVLLP